MWSWRRRCADLEVLNAETIAGRETRKYTGSHIVPIDSIVGTIARCCDFDRCFHPLRRHLRARLMRLRKVFQGRYLPAVRLRLLDDGYYVEDGHHRLAIARERGMLAVDAIVTCRC
jgi:hypothetical protein